MFPVSGQLKLEGKKVMGKTMPFWIKATFLFIGLQLLFHLLRGSLGGMLGWYLMHLSEFPEAVTGYSTIENGFQLVLRMEDLDAVAAISLTYGQIMWFLIINLLVFLILAPMKMAVVEQYWVAYKGETSIFKRVLHWYTDRKLFGKSIVVGLILDLGCRLIAILALLPSSALYAMIYSGSIIGVSTEESVRLSLLSFLALAFMIGGALLSFYLYTILYPIRYCLAARPDYSVGQVLRRGVDSIKGYRGEFFRFRLTFLHWYLMSFLTYGVIELYVLPYLSFSSFQFLQEAAKDRQEKNKTN
jgi:uncharacterized membrane protein